MTRNILNLFLMIHITLFSVALLPDNVAAATKMPKGSKIATVSIAGKTDDEVKQLLQDEITIWQGQEDLKLTSEFEQFTIPRDVFSFDINQTVDAFNERTKRTFTSLFMRPKNVQLPLEVEINEENDSIRTLHELDYINSEAIIENVLDIASGLEDTSTTISYIEGKEIPLDTIAKTSLKIPQLSDAVMTYAIDELHEYVIGPEDHFSFLETVELPESFTNAHDELSFIATALHTLFLQTNFDIVMRHPALSVQPYADSGTEAVINEKENKDLIIVNPNDKSYQIEVKKQKGKLNVALKASKEDVTYTYERENVKEIAPRTLYRYSKKIKPGDEQVIDAGKKGLTVDIYRSMHEKNVFLESERISRDVYVPEPRIVLVSTTDEVPEEDVMDEEETPSEIEKLEERIALLEEQINETGPILDLFPVDEDAPTFTEQVHDLKETQHQLEEQVSEISTDIDTSSVTSEKELQAFKEETEQNLDTMNEQLEKIFEFIIQQEREEAIE